MIFTGSDDKTVKLFDVKSGECVSTILFSGSVGNIQCHNNMLLTIIKRENNIYWYDLRSENIVQELEGHKDAVSNPKNNYIFVTNRFTN